METMKITAILAAVAAAVLLGPAARGGELVDTPKVLPDRAIDTSSLDGIIRGVCKPGMKPQERFLALYEFYRRMVFHNRYMGPDRRSVLRIINSYGYQLCGSQAASFSVLCRKAGFQTRVAHVRAKGYGVHTVMEVHYDGAWHVVDTMTAFYVLNRKGQIASLAELKADPTLIRDAVKEGRAPAEFCLCTREFEKEQAGIEKLMPRDRPWSLLRWGPGRTLPDFWQKAVRRYRIQEGLYGGHVQPGEMDIVLKPNEEYVRLWAPIGLWLKRTSFEAVPPFHTCGHIDELDEPNFRYFEPYKRSDFPHCRYCYRYYGNGYLEWKPDATRGEVAAVATGLRNLLRDDAGMFHTADPARPAGLTLPVRSPYAVVRIEIDLRLDQGAGAETSVSVGNAAGRRARFARVWQKRGAAKGLQKIVVDCTRDRSPKYRYHVRIDVKGKPVRFNVARLKTTFQLNPASLPSLYPGENTITVSAKRPLMLRRHRLLVTYEWADGDGWKTDHADTQTVVTLPHTYKLSVDVPADKMPRMKRLVLRLAPR